MIDHQGCATKTQILIAGCGYIGQRLAELLVADGHTVHAVRRHWHVDPPPGVKAYAVDLANPQALAALPPVDQVVFAAAAGAFTDDAYRRVYVDAFTNVLQGVRGVQRCVFTSSTGVYGVGDGGWVDEDSPVAAMGPFSAARLVEAEKRLATSGIPGVSLRLGGIYGPGRTSLLDSVRSRTARLSGPGLAATWTNRIHREDAARMVRHLLRLQNPEPIYLGVDDEPAPRDEILKFAAKLLQLPEPLIGLDTLAPQRGNRRCSNARIKASGYSFVYPTYREGFRSLVADR